MNKILYFITILTCLLVSGCEAPSQTDKNFSEVKIGKTRIRIANHNFSMIQRTGIDSRHYALTIDVCGAVTIEANRKAFDYISNYESDGFSKVNRFLFKKGDREYVIFEEDDGVPGTGPISSIRILSEDINCASAWFEAAASVQ